MGRLAAVVVNSDTNEVVYTPSATKTGVVTLSICNVSNSAVKFSVGFSGNADAIIGSGEYIEHEFELAANNTYERTGLVLVSPQSLVVKSIGGTVNAVVWGFEE